MRRGLQAAGKLLAAMLMLLPAACGYHLVGHGEGTGAIPADVHAITLAVSDESRPYLPLLRDRLQRAGYDLEPARSDAILRVMHEPESFVPSAYDRSGVATQYHMAVTGSLILERNGRAIWQSGNITVQDDIYVTAGPASIEASRQRLAGDLRREWVRQAWSRLQSGF